MDELRNFLMHLAVVHGDLKTDTARESLLALIGLAASAGYEDGYEDGKGQETNEGRNPLACSLEVQKAALGWLQKPKGD